MRPWRATRECCAEILAPPYPPSSCECTCKVKKWLWTVFFFFGSLVDFDVCECSAVKFSLNFSTVYTKIIFLFICLSVFGKRDALLWPVCNSREVVDFWFPFNRNMCFMDIFCFWVFLISQCCRRGSNVELNIGPAGILARPGLSTDYDLFLHLIRFLAPLTHIVLQLDWKPGLGLDWNRRYTNSEPVTLSIINCY